MKLYFYICEGKQQGPLSAQKLIECGINEETKVWAQGFIQWEYAKNVPEIAIYFGKGEILSKPKEPEKSAPFKHSWIHKLLLLMISIGGVVVLISVVAIILSEIQTEEKDKQQAEVTEQVSNIEEVTRDSMVIAENVISRSLANEENIVFFASVDAMLQEQNLRFIDVINKYNEFQRKGWTNEFQRKGWTPEEQSDYRKLIQKLEAYNKIATIFTEGDIEKIDSCMPDLKWLSSYHQKCVLDFIHHTDFKILYGKSKRKLRSFRDLKILVEHCKDTIMHVPIYASV